MAALSVSVVIPCTRTQYLKTIRKELKNQSYPCSEIIVIKDKDRRGVSWARNEGVRKASSDIILFLDDDNIPPRDWIEKYVVAFRKKKADVLGGNYIETNEFLSFIKNYFAASANAKKVGIGGNIGFTSKFIRKVIERDGSLYNEYFKYGSEDWELMSRIQSLKPKVFFLDNHNYHQKKLTLSNYIKLQYRRAKTVRLLKSLVSKYKLPSQESVLWNSSSSDHIRRKYVRTLNPFLFPRLDYYIAYWFGIVGFSLGYLMGKSAPSISVVIPKGYQFLNETKQSSFGGAEVQLSLLGEAMSKLFFVSMITASSSRIKKKQRGMRILPSFSFHDSAFAKFRKSWLTYKKSKSTHFIQRALSELSFFTAIYCFITRKKFVYMVAHDAEADGNHPLYKTFLGRLMVRMTFSLTHTLIVQNKYEAKHLEKYNPVILKKGVPHIPASKKKKFDVIWVARADEWKQPYSYLDLARSLPQYQFGMIIRSATDKQEQFKQLVAHAKKIPNIKVYTNMSFATTNALTAQSKVFCLTSSQEGDWPMTVLQALSASVPIVSLHLNHGTLVKEGAGYYAQHDMETLRKLTKDILTNTTKRESMSRNAKNYANTYHDFQTQTQQLMRYIL